MTHGLQTAHRTTALLAGLRPLGAAPANLAAGRDTGLAPALLLAPVHRAPRDGAGRTGVFAAMDAQNRVSIIKVSSALGWTDATPVVVTCEPGRVIARPGVPAKPTELRAKFVGGRLTLPAAARANLWVRTGDQVVAATVPGTDSLVLAAAADVLQQMTGPEDVACAPAPATTAPLSGGVKPRWQPAVTAAVR